MKKVVILVIALLFAALCFNVFGQSKAYPFNVTVSGKGERSILFIPGFACSGEVWDATQLLFEKNFTCHTLTMAGFAGVPAQPNPSFQGWEKAIAAYIRDNKLQKPVIVGHSMGGGLAMALAADYPELVSKIVVVDALPCLAALMDTAFKTKEKSDCSAMVSKYSSMPDEQFYQGQKNAIPQLLADTAEQARVVGWSVTSDRHTFAEMYCDFSNTDLREKITHITCPTLVLLESYFINFKPAIGEQFRGLKTASLQYATKGLHFIMYDDKDWFEEQVVGFIKQ